MSARSYVLDSPDRAGRAADHIRALDTSKPWELILRRHKRFRSLSQNRRYWLALQHASRETGNDAADLHEFFKAQFLEPVTVQVGTRMGLVPTSTTRLDVKSFAEYVDRVESFLASQGIWLDSLTNER